MKGTRLHAETKIKMKMKKTKNTTREGHLPRRHSESALTKAVTLETVAQDRKEGPVRILQGQIVQLPLAQEQAYM
jgi:methionine salvage enolase-phosphatase E1